MAAEKAVPKFIYSAVFRNKTVLTEYAYLTGNFGATAAKLLEKLPANNCKLSYHQDGKQYHYLVEGEYTYTVATDESCGRSLPHAFLIKVKDDFQMRYKASPQLQKGSAPSCLTKEYGPSLKAHMKTFMEQPSESDKMEKLKAQVNEVKTAMAGNIDKILSRGEKIENLTEKSEMLRSQASEFQKKGKSLRNKMWLENGKVKIAILVLLLVLGLIIYLSVCRGFVCRHKKQ